MYYKVIWKTFLKLQKTEEMFIEHFSGKRLQSKICSPKYTSAKKMYRYLKIWPLLLTFEGWVAKTLFQILDKAVKKLFLL